MIMIPNETTTTKTRATTMTTTTARREEEILTKMMMMPHQSSEGEEEIIRTLVKVVNPLLRIGVTCEDIFPIVELLLSQENNNSPKKKNEVQDEHSIPYKLHEELTQNFTSKQKESKYILLVQILNVSDGSSSASKKQRKSLINRLLGSSTSSSNKRKVNPSSSPSSANNNENIDVAKLEINYCLYLRSTNEVAMVDRKTYTKKKTMAPAASSKRMSKRISNSFNSNTSSDVLDDLMKMCATDLRRQIMSVSTQHPVPRRISSSTFRINPSPVANQPQRKESMIVVDKKYTTTTSMIPKPPQRLPSVDYESDHHHQIFRRISRNAGLYCVDEKEAMDKQHKQEEIQQKRLSDLEERWSSELLKQRRQGYRLPTI